MRRAVAAFVICVIAMAAAAGAAAATPSGVQTLLNPDGTGWLSADPSASGWTWQTCAASLAATTCAPFATGNPITTGLAPAGTAFVGTAADGSTAQSPIWNGNVHATSAPGVTGTLRVDALVIPTLAAWAGGWDGDYDLTQLAACASANGTDCTTLTDMTFPSGCPHGAAIIDPLFAGWYLRVADQRVAADTVFLAIGSLSPYGHVVWQPNAVTAVAVVGRIGRSAGPAAARCGPPPLPPNANPRHPGYCAPGHDPSVCAMAIISAQGAGRVWCIIECQARLTANRRGRTVDTMKPIQGVGTLSLKRRLLVRLGAGRATFRISIEGQTFATRHIRLRRSGRPQLT